MWEARFYSRGFHIGLDHLILAGEDQIETIAPTGECPAVISVVQAATCSFDDGLCPGWHSTGFVDNITEFHGVGPAAGKILVTVASTLEEPMNRALAIFLYGLSAAKDIAEWQIPCSLAPQQSMLQYI